MCLPYIDGEPLAHCRHGQWTPHATLGRRFVEQIGTAIAVISGGRTELAAEATGLRRWDSDQRVDHLLVG